MKDEIKSKLDEHIRFLLDKPSLSTEEYELLKQKYCELPKEKSENLTLFYLVLMLMFFGSGGEQNGL